MDQGPSKEKEEEKEVLFEMKKKSKSDGKSIVEMYIDHKIQIATKQKWTN